MDQPPIPATLDISGPEPWMRSHGALSDALSAITFCHPRCCSAQLRLGLPGRELWFEIESARRSRLGSFRWLDRAQGASFARAAELSADRLAAGLGAPQEEALSLARLLAGLADSAKAMLSGDPAFALRLGASLGLGASERWDQDHADGLGRGPEGCAAFERSILSMSELFPELALAAARAGARLCSGEAAFCASSMLAELEAQGMLSERSEPPAREPSRTSPRL